MGGWWRWRKVANVVGGEGDCLKGEDGSLINITRFFFPKRSLFEYLMWSMLF